MPLQYHRADHRPLWVTRIGITSTLFGALGFVAGAVRCFDAWESVSNPSTYWLTPPPVWVARSYFPATIASVAVSTLLMMAGVASLVWPSTVARVHVTYLAFKVPLVAVTLFLHLLLIPSRQIAMGVVLQLASACYAAFVLLVLRREKFHASSHG